MDKVEKATMNLKRLIKSYQTSVNETNREIKDASPRAEFQLLYTDVEMMKALNERDEETIMLLLELLKILEG